MRALLLLLLALSGPAGADPRIDQVLAAWSKGDSLAVQDVMSDPYAEATIGLAVETGGILEVIEQRGTDVELLVDGDLEIWQFHECETGAKFCSWNRIPLGRRSKLGGAEYGQALDVTSTAAALGMGLAEGNPLGFGIYPLKLALLHHANRQPYWDCVEAKTWLDSFGIGAGVANIVTLAAGVAAPVSLAVMAVSTLLRHDSARATAMKDCIS